MNYKKLLGIPLIIIALLWAGFVFFGQQAKKNAIAIFNEKMGTQKVLHGKLVVGDLDAHLDGTVNFKDLAWTDTEGEQLMKVGQGRLKLNPWDAVTGQMGTRSLSTIELENAEFIVHFNEKKRADIVSKKQADKLQDTNKSEINAGAETKAAEEGQKNIDLSDKVGQKHVILKNSTFTIMDKQHVYTLTNVNGRFDYNKGQLMLEVKTGKFAGTMIGDSLELKGQVGVLPGKDKLDLDLKLNNVVPKTLGLGNITNQVSLTGRATGTVKNMQVDGKIAFADLDLPKMHFNNLTGSYHYENNIIHVMDVKGNIFSGTVDAFGEYNFKTREHKIFITGHGLEASDYFSANNISCRLNLEMEMLNDGTKYGTVYRGYFKSGEGKYGKYAFNSIASLFRISGKDLHFNKVVLDTDMGEFHASAIDVVNKKMKLHGLSWQPHHRIKRSKKAK